MTSLIGAIIAGLPLVLIEILSRRFRADPELWRKLTHVLSAVAVVVLSLFLQLHSISLIAAGFVILLIITRRLKTWRSLYGVNRKTGGEIFFPLGVLAASLFAADTRIFVSSVLVMGIADTAASWAGIRFGKNSIKFSHKSLEGSLAFISTAVLIMLVMDYAWPIILLVALTGSVLELVSSRGSDNVTVPLGIVILLNTLT